MFSWFSSYYVICQVNMVTLVIYIYIYLSGLLLKNLIECLIRAVADIAHQFVLYFLENIL